MPNYGAPVFWSVCESSEDAAVYLDSSVQSIEKQKNTESTLNDYSLEELAFEARSSITRLNRMPTAIAQAAP